MGRPVHALFAREPKGHGRGKRPRGSSGISPRVTLCLGDLHAVTKEANKLRPILPFDFCEPDVELRTDRFLLKLNGIER
jgi:hypothetical protein